MEVQISTGIYRIASIVSDTIINICNDGSGVTPGTVIDAIDAAGVYVVPILPVGVALCGGSNDTEGALVICADGVPTILSGSTLGYVPAVTNAVTHDVEFTDPATLFSIDPCLWDLSDRVQNGIVNYFTFTAGSALTVGNSYELDREGTTPVLIENDTCVDCEVILSFSGYSECIFNVDDGDYANATISLYHGSDTDTIGTTSVSSSAVVAAVPKEIAFNRTAAAIEHTLRVEWMQSYTIPAGEELQVGFKVNVSYNAGNINNFNTGNIYGEIIGYFLSI
jgi:hypothetical protein